MRYRVGGLLLALVVLESGYFYWQNRDVVALGRPAAELAADPAFPQTARRVLERPFVTRRVLERMAEAATRGADVDLHVAALQRIAAAAPGDRDVQLRLAEALRGAGRLAEAEALYRAQAGPAGARANGNGR